MLLILPENPEFGDGYRTKTFNNVQDLAQKIKESVKKISLKSIHDAIDCFRSRVYEVEKNHGGLIINKYY